MLSLCRKEVRQLWREQRLPAFYFLLVLAMVIALGGTLRSNRQESRQSARAAGAEYDRWLNQGEKYAHAAAHYGIYVFRPVYGLANLDPGIRALVGHSVWLEAHVQNGLLYRPLEDGTALERLGDFSPAFLLITLLPLFVILLGHGSFAAERERGTLRLALIHTRRVRNLIFSKLIVLFSAAALPVLTVFAFAGSFAHTWRMAEPPSDAARWSLLLLVYLALLLIWTLTTLGVSSLVRSSSHALTVLLSLWCLLGLVVPRFAAELAAAHYPAPTQQRLAASMTEALGDVEGGDREAVVKQRLMAQYHVDSVDKLPLNWEGVLRNEGEEAGDRVFDHFWGELFLTYRLQQAMLARLSLASPMLGASWLSGRLASTDVDAHIDFIEAAETHRRFLEAILNQQIEQKLADPSVLRPNSGREVWQKVPPFHFSGYPLAQPQAAPGQSSSTLNLWFAAGSLLVQLLLASFVLLTGAWHLRRERL